VDENEAAPTRSSNERHLHCLRDLGRRLDPGSCAGCGAAAVVGVMVTGSAANAPSTTLFREALAALGYVEGRNLRLDFRFADGDAKRFPEMAEAFVQE